MSKHNDIYSILGKLSALQPAPQPTQTAQQTAQQIYESVEAQGSILSGVNKVEATLTEKYAGFKTDESALQAYLGKKKYGEPGMKALQKAGREGASKEKMAKIRAQHDKMDENDMEEGNEFSGKLVKARAQGDKKFELDGKEYPVQEGDVAEGMFGIDSRIKGKIQNITSDISDVPGMWDHKAQTFTSAGMEKLKSALNDNPKYIKYALNLNYKDYEAEGVAEGFDDLQAYMKKKEGPQPKGGSGKIAGRRYGGSAQKDDEGDAEVSTEPKKKGRPKKDKFAESELDEKAPPGAKAERMVKHIKQGYAKDGKLTPKEKSIAFATARKAHKAGKLSEGVLYEGGDEKLDQILNRFKNEVKRFQAGDEINDDLYMALFDYYMDQGEIPYGIAKARDGDPYQWVEDRLADYLGMSESNVISIEDAKGPVNPALGRDALPPSEKLAPHAGVGRGPVGKAIGSAMTTAKNVGRFIQGKPEIPTLEDQELTELARLAGLSEAKKCNSTMEGKSCPIHGLKECGSMNEAKPDFLDLDKDGDKKEPMKKAAKEKVDECGPEMSPMSQMGQDQGSLSINTSMNSDGTKSVSVNATGEQADALAQMLKMAGIGGHSHSTQQPRAVVIQAGPDEPVEEEREATYANTPDEEVETVDAIMHQGNDLNREKEQYADRPKAGDNPMATPAREAIEMPKQISRMLQGVKRAEK